MFGASVSECFFCLQRVTVMELTRKKIGRKMRETVRERKNENEIVCMCVCVCVYVCVCVFELRMINYNAA